MSGLHKCSDTECPYFAQSVTRGCGCYKSDEQVLRELNAELAEALRALVVETERYVEASEGHLSDSDFELDFQLGESNAILTVAALPNARAALAKAVQS